MCQGRSRRRRHEEGVHSMCQGQSRRRRDEEQDLPTDPFQRHVGTYYTPLEEVSRWCEKRRSTVSGVQRFRCSVPSVGLGESTSVDKADLSHVKQMEFCLHIVRAHSDLLGSKWSPHIFRTMILKLCGKKSYRPRVESKLAPSEPFKVKKEWVTLKRATRLTEQKGRAGIGRIVENVGSHDTVIF